MRLDRPKRNSSKAGSIISPPVERPRFKLSLSNPNRHRITSGQSSRKPKFYYKLSHSELVDYGIDSSKRRKKLGRIKTRARDPVKRTFHVVPSLSSLRRNQATEHNVDASRADEVLYLLHRTVADKESLIGYLTQYGSEEPLVSQQDGYMNQNYFRRLSLDTVSFDHSDHLTESYISSLRQKLEDLPANESRTEPMFTETEGSGTEDYPSSHDENYYQQLRLNDLPQNESGSETCDYSSDSASTIEYDCYPREHDMYVEILESNSESSESAQKVTSVKPNCSVMTSKADCYLQSDKRDDIVESTIDERDKMQGALYIPRLDSESDEQDIKVAHLEPKDKGSICLGQYSIDIYHDESSHYRMKDKYWETATQNNVPSPTGVYELDMVDKGLDLKYEESSSVDSSALELTENYKYQFLPDSQEISKREGSASIPSIDLDDDDDISIITSYTSQQLSPYSSTLAESHVLTFPAL